MLATVTPWTDEPIAPMGSAAAAAAAGPASNGAIAGEEPGPDRRSRVLAIGAAVCLAIALAFLFYDRVLYIPRATATASAPQKSLAVLPFLDLTSQKMDEEYFADGMTEELIDRLSKIPGLRVPAPTSSFYFKGKKMTITDIAKSLGVAYVLDGSVRKSSATLRVAARLIRANDGYVVWTETYDRPYDDKLAVQDEIASEVAKALSASFK
jgi:TolB-like protein